MLGKITITHADGLNVHTYTSPADGWSVNSHIIELPGQLFIVDAQLTLVYGREVMEYAITLHKPLNRLYITHHHPDHLLGAGAFPIKSSALAEVTAKIEATGDFFAGALHAKMGNAVPQKAVRPEIIIKPGSELVEDIQFEFIRLKHAETEDALMIGLPDQGILITQDMVYNKIHAYLGEQSFDEWLTDISFYQQLTLYKHILPGHGGPGGPELLADMADYIHKASRAYQESPDYADFEARLSSMAPEFSNDALLKLSQRAMFPKKTSDN